MYYCNVARDTGRLSFPCAARLYPARETIVLYTRIRRRNTQRRVYNREISVKSCPGRGVEGGGNNNKYHTKHYYYYYENKDNID